MSDDVIRENPNPYEEARCGLADCGEPLFMTWTSNRAIYLSDTTPALADPSGAHATSWQVECAAGHVVLLPLDTAEDYYEFGGCTCNPDYPNWPRDFLCGHHDIERLREVTAGGTYA